MASGTQEIHLEQHIEDFLVQQDHYHVVSPQAYDPTLCLLPEEVIAFIKATQPKAYQALEQQHGTTTDEKIVARVARNLQQNKTLHVLRQGVKGWGQKLHLLYFKPANDKTPEHEQWYTQNRLAVIRQLKYSTKNGNSIDMVLFVNGIPVVTIELKNALTGQNHHHAIRQYIQDRDPKGEPLLEFQRCLVHFAVGTEKVFMTTRLQGKSTYFLPFNQGLENHHPTSYAVSYLWEDVLRKDSLLDLIQRFISLQTNQTKVYDPATGQLKDKTSQVLLFPRFHQRRAVHRLLEALRQDGVGQNYLIQHSAGSGKSNTITWLAYCLANFYQHYTDARGMFDCVFILTDRRVLNHQIQNNIRQLDHTPGMVAYLDAKTTSQDLQKAIEQRKRIIVTTIQKFPKISETVARFTDRKYAILIDEAHSSQSGETASHVSKALSLEDAAQKDEEAEALDDVIIADILRKGQQPNISQFAFTATPKPKTIELFGTLSQGKKKAFDEYTMEQAIKEGFILDVLQNYMSFRRYYKLAKLGGTKDKEYDKKKTVRILNNYVDLQPHAIATKTRIMLEHFASHTQNELEGQARAMLVTRSRLHAVRYKLKFDQVMQDMHLKYEALVAFSGTVHDADTGQDYTEAALNQLQGKISIPEALKLPKYRLLIVANKYQTGFDEPMMHTMFVDKKLGGANAVQTLSRLNRTARGKAATMVLDFINDPELIQEDFQHFYGGNYIREENLTDPNSLYDVLQQAENYQVYYAKEVETFAEIHFKGTDNKDQLQPILNAVVKRCQDTLDEEQQTEFKAVIKNFSKAYRFLRQIMTFVEPDFEKHAVFFTALVRKLPYATQQLPLDVVNDVELDSYKIQHQYTTRLELESGDGEDQGLQPEGSHQSAEEEYDLLSKIIKNLNDTYGLDLTEEDKVEFAKMKNNLAQNADLMAYFNAQNSKDNIRDKFNEEIDNELLNFINTKLDFYNKMTEDRANTMFKTLLFNELYAQWVGRRQ